MRTTYSGGRGSAAVILLLCSSASFAACSTDSAADAPLDTDDAKASYSIGVNVGQNLVPMAERIDHEAFMRGFDDAVAESDLALTPEEMQSILQSFAGELQQAHAQAASVTADSNLATGTAFLETNGQREGVTTTESGLQYEVLVPGDGAKPGPEDQVVVNYRGTLIDGTEFDSSEPGQPAMFGVGGVIPGFSEGLQLMPVGGKYKLFIPAALAYGPQDRGSIPPNSTLVFDLELIEIK